MPLNKLENFIKNTEGRILYVNPNDLDSTDGIENQGNSLTKPFKTIQRALIEAARFSYLRGDDNDLVERTTILLYPGEHIVDNRPGFAIKNEGGAARAVSPAGATTGASNVFELTLDSNFDLTQEDNLLYKFNSINGGVIVPRGTSIVGLDLRKTKIRPKYVPNPTDSAALQTAIFRITGACYFWQFTIFDGDESGTVYTDPVDFSINNISKPTFSHHKVTCFEYADGVTKFDQFSGLSDLDIYYSKLTNAFNRASGREIDLKYPASPKSFAPQRPEFEIVGAFATDPLNVTNIESGDGATPGQRVTVTTAVNHNLTGGTPIKIRGVNVPDYNISTKVATVLNDTQFTYLLPFIRPNLPAGVSGGLSSAKAQVLVETDTVTGASPYIFNVSLRSVFGMQGMHADGSKADGFKSMVVAQFTAVSLQKDDRAFVKYDPTNRRYTGIQFSKQTGELLSSESSSTNPETVYHLDQEANYRKGFRTSHIKVSNDSVVQIVSVFAIGFHSHFNMISGADASITNSNSNFGTFALAAEGFKKDAFDKDDKGFVTSVITPRSVVTTDQKIEYNQIVTSNSVANISPKNNRLYFLGATSETNPPSHIAQGFRVGAKVSDTINIDPIDTTLSNKSATIVMSKPDSGAVGSVATSDTSEKKYEATHSAATTKQSVYTIDGGHNLGNAESIRIIADNGDLPENIDPHRVYYAITREGDSSLAINEIRIAASETNAKLASPIFIRTIASTTDKFNVISRVSDKKPGDAGHPIQFDKTSGVNQWFIHVSTTGNTIHSSAASLDQDNLELTHILRKDDDRSLDEKIYKLRYVVPKELVNARDPIDGFVLQDSSSTTVTADSDFSKNTITQNDYTFNRNPRFISQVKFESSINKVTIRSDKPHNVNVGDQIITRNIQSSTNTSGVDNKGFNGTFIVTDIDNPKEFKYSNTDVNGLIHNVGTFVNNTHTRNTLLPRFDRSDNKDNLFIYRTEVITPYIQGVQDGIYHLFVLNADNVMNEVSNEFDADKFNQNIVNLYPEYDRDNVDDNPPEATSFAKRFPIGDVVTNDLKKSITRETTNKFIESFDLSSTVSSVTDNTTSANLTFNEDHGLQALKFVKTSDITGGSGHSDGTYFNVKLLNNTAAASNSNWDGATAKVTVSSGAVTSAEITEGGSGYTNDENLFFDSASVATGGIGGAASAKVQIKNAGISSATGNYVQVTGITTGTDSYHRIDSIISPNSFSVKKTASDKILEGQKVIDLGPWVVVRTTSPGSNSNETIFNCSQDHGLEVGNSFRVLDANDSSLGDFVVKQVGNVITFLADTNVQLTSAKYILKHGLSPNEASSSSDGENVGIRGLSFYDHYTFDTSENVLTNDSSFKITLRGEAASENAATQLQIIQKTLPIGSYIQIRGEIMRISSSIVGSGNEITVIRGALGTIISQHPNDSVIKKINPLSIEFRRPSILRASGHTFEYVGYGPGNYSTALPQLQNRTLTEREEFLSQSQETSCGNVVYTGMNDKGDFYIGNTKISSSSGQQTTFDIPIPSITGEDPNRLSAVFDEVIVKERLLVEGGATNQILSQFDGPVTFNGDVRLSKPGKKLTVKGTTNLDGNTKITEDLEVTAPSVFKDTVTINAANKSLQIQNGSGVNKFTIDTDNGNTITEGNITIKGDLIGDNATNLSAFDSITATSFSGSGSSLTGIVAEKIKLNDESTDTSCNVIFSTAATGDLEPKTGSNLTFNSNSGELTATSFSGDLTGNVTGDLTGNASKVTISTESTDETCGIVFNDGSLGDDKTLHINSGLSFNSANKQVTIGGDIVGKKFLYLGTLTDSASGDILTTGGSDASSSLKITNNESDLSKLSIAGRKRSVSDITSVSLDDDDYVNICHFSISGDSNTPEFTCDGDVVAFALSDKNLKNNIKPLQNALDMINSLSGNTFTWKPNVGTKSETDDIGVIAQEVEALGLPGISTTRDDGTKAVKYEKLVPILIEAVKELSAKVTALENK